MFLSFSFSFLSLLKVLVAYEPFCPSVGRLVGPATLSVCLRFLKGRYGTHNAHSGTLVLFLLSLYSQLCSVHWILIQVQLLVDGHVLVHVGLLLECLVADGAGEGSLTRVDPHVRLQVVLGGKLFAAVDTLKYRMSNSRSHF